MQSKSEQYCMKYFLKLFLPVVILNTSCQKDLDLSQLGSYENKIVLNGLLYADSVGRVNISRTSSITDKDNSSMMLENASVTMNVNDQSFVYQYDTTGYYFLPEKKMLAGESYEFTVSNEGYPTVSSSVSIPFKTTITSVDTSVIYTPMPGCLDCGYSRTDKIKLNLKSSTPEKEYYLITLIQDNLIGWNEDSTYFDSTIYASDELGLYTFNKNLKLVKGVLYLEEIFNEDLYGVSTKLYFEKPAGETEYSVTIYNYSSSMYCYRCLHTLSFTVFSEDYFKHLLSLARAYRANDDFLTEKAGVYSNIKDGMGILAGANQTKKKIALSIWY
jgi:hypothetical protein